MVRLLLKVGADKGQMLGPLQSLQHTTPLRAGSAVLAVERGFHCQFRYRFIV